MALSSCGKSYATEDEAARSKRVITGTGEAVQCWIRGHGWHVRTAPGDDRPAGHQPARTSTLRPRSHKTQAVYRDRAALAAGLLENVPWCQIAWDGGCTGRSTEVHEPEMRSRGADILDEDACVTACHYCHMAAHAHPAEATARGFMVPSKPVDKPWQVVPA